ncbi:MAG: hypothetical protein JXX29_19980 [Deltaproteobacteria bacterium]|nr:hypothetical protein [Deltaproteobacteria bacterium]MBN2673971.1 hypothetical protein [Deltaproteobacteria bacterium]
MRPCLLACIIFLATWIGGVACESFIDPDGREVSPLEIESVYPDLYDTDFAPNDAIRIKFNKHLDSNYLMTSQLQLRSGNVGKWLMAYYDPIRMELVVWTSSPLFENTVWDFNIIDELRALDGTVLQPTEVTRFRTDTTLISTPVFARKSFTDDIQPIFNRHCIQCHGKTQYTSLDLRNDNSIGATAINIVSIGWPELDRISPYRPGASYLLYKLLGSENIAGQPMPRTLEHESQPTQLSDEEKRTISDWIAGGAIF